MLAGIPSFDKDDVKQVIKKIESKNGNKIADFSIKEIVLMLHKDQKKEISKINTKLDKHIEWASKNNVTVHKMIADHDKIMQHITETLPEKGFCEKVNIALFPEDDISLSKKTETLWHDRRWVKLLTGGVISALAIAAVNFAFQVAING